MAETSVQQRVDRLEIAMEQLIRQVDRTSLQVDRTSAAVAHLSREVDRFKQEMDRFREEMDRFREEMDKFREEMRDFKEEMRREMKEFKEEMRREMKEFKQEMNRRWGELANRLGTLVEDIVAPAVPDVIKRHFNLEIELMGIRMRRKMSELKGEYDVVAMADGMIFIVEVKSRFNIEYVRDFQEKLAKFRDLFPEYGDRQLVGIIASLRLDDEVVKEATGRGFYAMAMKGEYMDLINVEELRGRG